MDNIPKAIRISAEKNVRKRRAFISRQAERACALELRIRLTTEQMKKNLEPPYQRPEGVVKRERRFLTKRKKIEHIEKVEISEVDKLFYKAFTECESSKLQEFKSADDVAILKSLQDNCIPFYFDFFLKQHDYFPSYDFKTEIELREGPETNHFKYEDVLENVFEFLRQWEQHKQQQIEKHIRETWHLYIPST